MVRDVLIENPQSAKSEKIQLALDERNDPMPDYMRAQINQGHDTLSEIEFVRSDISRFKRMGNTAFNNLHYLYRTDTLIENVNDSLLALYSKRGGLLNEYRKAMIFFVNDDTLATDSIVENLKYKFELTDSQEDEREDYLEYFSIKNRMKRNELIAPDSIAIKQLSQMQQNGLGMPAVFALGALVYANVLDYNEPLLKADTAQKSEQASIFSSEKDEMRDDDPWLSVKPNPTSGYFIADYNIPAFSKSVHLLLTDTRGVSINKVDLPPNTNEIVVPVDKLKPGIYIISLVIDGKVLESCKITIVK